MLRRPIFWIILCVVSLVSGWLAQRHFSQAFPVVNLDLKMDRSGALARSQELASRFAWGPADYQQAASFSLDRRVQNFVELEAGGTDAFSSMLQDGLYSPFTWRVRHFKEGETRETLVRFTEAGKPYGFAEKLAEDMPGLSLTREAALDIAETSASEDWELDLSEYNLVEESQENRPAGRADHTFVYERTDVQLGEGRYRLRLVVGGNRLTELTHFIKIPESFSRRYEEMRSANNTIAAVAQIAVLVLYLIGGCIIGLFFLLRQRWVIWRAALFWGLLIAFLQFLSGINALPLAWMGYDTALSSQNFLFQQLIQQLALFLALAVLLTLTFMGAESLSRKAFPGHVQLWRIWSKDVASSPAILGQTMLGYLGVSIFFAYEVALYFLTQKHLGWWAPSSSLFEPDTLATYFPWLTSIANSAQAGFWEECLFRAVPIAGAALLGQRFGYRKIWIVAAIILQAVIFGAGHANYPAQPAYARVAELVIPSLAWGLVYLGFGLLPAIVMHFAYDVVWFALPLFVASSPGIWVDRILVIILTMIPLWILLIARLRVGQWRTIGAEHLNAGWNPPPQKETPARLEPVDVSSPVLGQLTRKVLPITAVLGLILWVAATEFKNFAPPLLLERDQVRAMAEDQLAERGFELSGTWKRMTTVDAPLNQNDRFVWQIGGAKTYESLMGNYLGPPFWKVRFAKFEGDVAERAEEFEVYVLAGEQEVRFRHQLPEARPGASLSEEEARKIAERVIQQSFGLNPDELKVISSEPSKLPQRQDWVFTYADPEGYPMTEGEARLRVAIAGDEVVDTHRFVYVPEEWVRQETSERTISGILEISSQAVIILTVLAGAIMAIVSWSKRAFAVRAFLWVLLSFLVLRTINVFNGWPTLQYGFRTAEPYKNQLLIFGLGSLVGTLVVSATIALAVGLIHHWNKRYSLSGIPHNPIYGVYLGVALVGFASAIGSISPSLSPNWATYSVAGWYLPVLGTSLQPVLSYVTESTVALLIVAALTIVTERFRKRKLLATGVLVVLGLVVVGSSGISAIWAWLLTGILVGLLFVLAYRYVISYQMALVLPAVAVILIAGLVRESLYMAYPGALPGSLLAILLVAGLTFYWYRQLAGQADQVDPG